MSDPNQNSGSSRLIASAIATVAASGVVVVLRLITRIKILHFTGGEDWCILLAYTLSIGNTIGMTYQAKFALGRHLASLSPEQILSCLKAFYATVFCYNMSLTFTKLSILLQYLRIFKVRQLLIACYALMAVVALFGLVLFITGAFPCWPVAAFWDLRLKGWCFPQHDIWIASAALNIATDLMIFILPIPVIKGLNLPTKQKAALLGVFMLGFFVCIISILRLPSLKRAVASTDFSYDNIGIAIWSCVELNAAILCACLPTLKPLVAHFFPRLLSTARQSSRSNYLRYSSNRDVTNRGTWNRSMLSKAETNVKNRTVHDSESGRGIVTVEEDLVLDCLELQARKDAAKEMRHSEATERRNESSGCSSQNGDWVK